MTNSHDISRRSALTGLALGASMIPQVAQAAQTTGGVAASSLTVAAKSPWLVNGVTATDDGTIFLGLPRWGNGVETPSIARVEKDGKLTPFPGGAWNEWKPGADPRNCFVNVNSLHIFEDNTLWAVDVGGPWGEAPVGPGAQKVVRMDPRTGSLLTVLHFDKDILPTGASLNDLRQHDQMLYFTDSGLGGIIVHDLTCNKTVRRLSGNRFVTATGRPLRGFKGRPLDNGKGKRPKVASDPIELSADGLWLWWSTPTGPFRRISTAALVDPRLTDDDLAGMVETMMEMPTIGGSALDTLDNFYLSDVEHRRITVVTPGGVRTTLAADNRMVSPDGLFITKDRNLLIPASQIEHLPQYADGVNRTQAPFLVFSVPLPESIAGHPLGNAVTGRRPSTGMSNFYGIEHVAMTVPDHDAAVRFLEEAFGAVKLYSHIKKTDRPYTGTMIGKINGLEVGTAMIAASQMRFANGPNIEIFELKGYGNTKAAGINDVGLVHFSVVVEDIHEAGARFKKAGGKLLEGPFDLGMNETGHGNQNWFGQMPWGTWVEFMTFESPLRYEPRGGVGRWFPALA